MWLFNINNLAFMPMIGFSVAVSVMVGQYLGQNRPDLAKRSAYSCFHITFLYMITMIAAFLLIPEIFIKPFIYRADAATYTQINQTVKTLLKFVALYSFFDIFNIIFSGAIKGAGDTRFVMFMLLIMSVSLLIIPSYFVLVVFNGGYLRLDLCDNLHKRSGLSFYLRFLGRQVESMRVIEI
jgi:MATE family multidrug resistance protein